MSYRLKISAALFVSSALLVTGCATTSQTPSNSNNNYVLPKQVNEGYWAATSLINDEAIVVSFRPGVANNYSFECNTNGSYKQVGVESYQMVPSSTGIGLQAGNNPVFSEIKVKSLVAKKSLTLNQLPSDPAIRNRLPNGLDYNYRYTSTITPICP